MHRPSSPTQSEEMVKQKVLHYGKLCPLSTKNRTPTHGKRGPSLEVFGANVREMLQKFIQETIKSTESILQKVQCTVEDFRSNLGEIRAKQDALSTNLILMTKQLEGTHGLSHRNCGLIDEIVNTTNSTRSEVASFQRRLNHMEQLAIDNDVIVSNVESTISESPIEVIKRIGAVLKLPIS